MLSPLKPGDMLRDRYRIVDIIGQGGMGSIYQAEDIRLEGRITAIKQIDTSSSGRPASWRASIIRICPKFPTILPKTAAIFW